MGRLQVEVLRGAVRRILQRRFGNSVRSALDSIEGAELAPCPPTISSCTSGLISRSRFRFFSSSTSSRGFVDWAGNDFSRAQNIFVLPENLQPLQQEGLVVLSPNLSKRLYVNFCVGPASVLNPVANVGKVFGSVTTLSRNYRSLSGDGSKLEENVDEAVTADGVRGEGQGGDEGVTASVSGRETPAKKPRRRKAQVQGNAREIAIGVEAASSNVTTAVVDSDGREVAISVETANNKVTGAGINFGDEELGCSNARIQIVSHRNPGVGRRKRNKEAVSSQETRSKAAALEHELSPDSVPESTFSSNAVFSNGNGSSVGREDGLSSGLPCSPTSPVFGMDATEEIPAVRDVSAGSGEKLFQTSPDTGWLDSDVEKHADSKKGDMGSYLSKSPGVGCSPNEQEQRLSSFTSVVEEHLKDLHKQTWGIGAGGIGTVDVFPGKKDKHLESGSSLKSGSVSAVDSSVDAADYTDPNKVYKILQGSRGGRAFQGQEKGKLNSIFYRFSVSGWVSDQALSLYINSKFFPSAAARFRKYFMHRSSPELRSYVVAKGPTNEALQYLFPSFAEFCIQEFSDEIRRYRELVSTADMTKPDAWYPFARAMKRKVIYHKGPTNSGKTYKALKRLMEAESGIYCSPLRLLAMEVFDTVNLQGVYCNLHTGQEKKDVPFANHLACTIEMCYLNKQWEVAVIDEIQMMSDEYRGWAWTRAFLGLQADEIHVCGDPSALPLVRNICAGTGDELVENEYERFKPLKVAEESLRGDFRNIEAGDCIVAFSRRDIFDIKREVELATKHRCCVVYGALPPETRTQQAKLFNEQDNGYDVLVASDAIGMGLNLNIRRVVFFSLDKFDGDSKKPVPPAQVKQIAGRAGRRGSVYPEGVTTTFFSQDLPYLGTSLLQAFEPSTAAGLFPVYEQVELFASQLPNENFATLLERFSETCKLDGAYFLCRYDNLKRVANMLEKVKGLSLEDRFNFCFAPVNVRDPQSMGALYRYATAFSQKIPVHVEMGVPSSSARDEFELLDLEARHQVLSMYLWLSQHFPGDLFPQKEQAGEMASQIAVLLGQSLVQSSRRWSKRKLNPTHGRGRPLLKTGPTYSRKPSSRNSGTRPPVPAENVIGV